MEFYSEQICNSCNTNQKHYNRSFGFGSTGSLNFVTRLECKNNDIVAEKLKYLSPQLRFSLLHHCNRSFAHAITLSLSDNKDIKKLSRFYYKYAKSAIHNNSEDYRFFTPLLNGAKIPLLKIDKEITTSINISDLLDKNKTEKRSFWQIFQKEKTLPAKTEMPDNNDNVIQLLSNTKCPFDILVLSANGLIEPDDLYTKAINAYDGEPYEHNIIAYTLTNSKIDITKKLELKKYIIKSRVGKGHRFKAKTNKLIKWADYCITNINLNN